MLHQLGRVAREARLAAGRSQIEVATTAGVSHAVISRLESGGRWPRDPDRIVAAYAAECGVSERKIWGQAVENL